MIKTIKDSAPDPGFDRYRRPTPADGHEGQGSDSHPAPHDEPDLRLVIEPDGQSGDYIYKLINRTTGVEVARLTRAQVAKLSEKEAYTAGTVIRTKA